MRPHGRAYAREQRDRAISRQIKILRDHNLDVSDDLGRFAKTHAVDRYGVHCARCLARRPEIAEGG